MIGETAKKTLIERTYWNILNMIGDGRLKPTEFLSHRLLAEELNISKQPVGIALQHLEYDGVVESIPRVGTRVRQVTAEDMWGMLQWRIGIEMRTAALACEYAPCEEVERLFEQADELDKLFPVRKTAIKEIRRKDMAFHLRIAELSGCERLSVELTKLDIYYLKNSLCEAVQITRDDFPSQAAVPHRKLVEAISRRDHNVAAETMERHLEESADMRKFVEWYRKNKGMSR